MKQKVFLLVLGLFLTIAYLILWPVPVNPVSWKPSVNTGYIDDYAPNSDLANLELIDIGETHGPEDIVYYQNKIYTSSQEGIILEIDPVNLTHREYANTGGSAL
ncbi:MAG: SMP-30/gluconolactonase/LRE family protein, partial [Hellea sp.]|nr:SMP-30/gluconolactonase/LRE family protein [Hellea sp.]